MQQFLISIRNSLNDKNWHAALFLALSMPDICSKLETPEQVNGGLRYRAWFDKYLASINMNSIQGTKTIFMSAGDCYALRCAILHEGSADVIEQRARETVTNFRFTTMAMHRVKNGNVLVLNVARFCEEVCRAVESWCADVQNSQEVIDRMTDVLNIEDGRNGFTF
jgi:hypothetical protein